MIIKAISVRQPWATAIVLGWKPWENRPQSRAHRGPLLIHAAKTQISDFDECVEFCERVSGRRFPDEVRFGGIIGAVDMVGCAPPLEHDDGLWRFAGQYGLEFERALQLPFRAYQGALGLFRVEITGDEERALRAGGLLSA